MTTLTQTESETHPAISVSRPTDSEIAALAYRLWEARGCPIGSPEEDWFSAEAELMTYSKVSTAVA